MPIGPPRRTLLKLLLLGLFLSLTNFDLFGRAGSLLNRGQHAELLAFVGIWAISIAALIVAAFLPRLWMRAFWAVPICLSTFVGNAIYALTFEELTFYDVLLYWSERSHAGAALETYGPWLLWPAAKALFGVLVLIMPVPNVARRFHGLFVAPAVPVLMIATLLHATSGKGTRGLPDQFKGLSMGSVLALRLAKGDLRAERGTVRIAPDSSLRSRYVILVVDEGVRADFLDLNVDRGTTPYLASQAPRIANFGPAVSANNCSMFSHLILRLGGVRNELARSLRSGPFIWQYARRAGYRTVYIDGQKEGGRLQNGMTLLERRWIDDFIQLDAVDPVDRDQEIARRLPEIVSGDSRVFVYVVKSGSHFPYARRYPLQEPPFTPHLEGGKWTWTRQSRERLVNSYKNSIRWNVDGFFEELLRGLDLKDGSVIYTSDHGQNLMDKGIVRHCNSSDPVAYEAWVPLLFITAQEDLRPRALDAALHNFDRATHFEIFPTLLALFGYTSEEIHAGHGPTLFDPLPLGEKRFTCGPVIVDKGHRIRWSAVPTDLLAHERAGR